ncbi:MAG: maleylacetoacetate isomerase [Pseudomonadota bacterium]
MAIKLYGYWRSSTSYRTRIALNLKGLAFEHKGVHLVKGEQRVEAYRELNPLAVVPTVEYNGRTLTQSPAILEYLEEIAPDPPLLPAASEDRARVRAMAAIIGCDIHPIANLSVLKYLKAELEQEQAEIDAWVRHWVLRGLAALEAMIEETDAERGYCFGADVTMADVYLAPQMYNARRFSADLTGVPKLVRIDRSLSEHPAFAAAAPERQPDAE